MVDVFFNFDGGTSTCKYTEFIRSDITAISRSTRSGPLRSGSTVLRSHGISACTKFGVIPRYPFSNTFLRFPEPIRRVMVSISTLCLLRTTSARTAEADIGEALSFNLLCLKKKCASFLHQFHNISQFHNKKFTFYFVSVHFTVRTFRTLDELRLS